MQYSTVQSVRRIVFKEENVDVLQHSMPQEVFLIFLQLYKYEKQNYHLQITIITK